MMDPDFEARVKALHERFVMEGMSANDAAAAAFTMAVAEKGSVRKEDGDGGAHAPADGKGPLGPSSSVESMASSVSMDKDASVGEEAPMEVEVAGLSLDGLRPLLDEASTSGDYSGVLSYLNGFERSEVLNASFPPPPGSTIVEGGININIEAVAEFYRLIKSADERYSAVSKQEDGLSLGPVKAAQLKLCQSLSHDPMAGVYEAGSEEMKPSVLKQFLVLLENPDHIEPPFYDVTEVLLLAVKKLPDKAKDMLRDWLVRCDPERFQRWLGMIQQYVTVRCVEQSFEEVKAGVRVMAIFFKANLKERKVNIQSFYNDAINSELESEEGNPRFTVSEEYHRWRQDLRAVRQNRQQQSGGGGAPARGRYEVRSLICYPFVLDPAIKSRIMNLDAVDQMRAEIEDEMQFALAGGQSTIRPYLILQVRREHIIVDTIQRLALYENYDLKKPLKVQFIGEEGIDEGGVQKEYFQVLFRQMLSPAYGMFRPEEESGLLWFIPDSQSPPEEFELVGTILGIAIYNSVILDMRFPMAVYKKLMGAPLSLDDLKAFQPAVAQSLANLLKHQGDVADVGLTFQVSYTPTYSEPEMVELKPGGAELPVTNENLKEYVELYVDWLLTKSVAPHFDAFRKGFLKVCGGDALRLFQPEELELLICGNPVLDFEALERVTQYEDGVEKDSPLIRNFWTVVHQFSPEEKKLFLKFATGSDRAPINGLASMNFVISKNGDGDDRLPTAHTCFNHLLLPAYSTLDKLKERLSFAITQSEGFGLR